MSPLATWIQLPQKLMDEDEKLRAWVDFNGLEASEKVGQAN
jgi:hypothetical protein